MGDEALHQSLAEATQHAQQVELQLAAAQAELAARANGGGAPAAAADGDASGSGGGGSGGRDEQLAAALQRVEELQRQVEKHGQHYGKELQAASSQIQVQPFAERFP